MSFVIGQFHDAQLPAAVRESSSGGGTYTGHVGAEKIESTQLLPYALSFLRKSADSSIRETKVGENLIFLKKS